MVNCCVRRVGKVEATESTNRYKYVPKVDYQKTGGIVLAFTTFLLFSTSLVYVGRGCGSLCSMS